MEPENLRNIQSLPPILKHIWNNTHIRHMWLSILVVEHNSHSTDHTGTFVLQCTIKSVQLLAIQVRSDGTHNGLFPCSSTSFFGCKFGLVVGFCTAFFKSRSSVGSIITQYPYFHFHQQFMQKKFPVPHGKSIETEAV